MHSVFPHDVRYAGIDDYDDLNRTWILEFTGLCPQCGQTFRTWSQSSGSSCGCEGIKWRLNLTVTTDHLPGGKWSRSQVRTRALQIIAQAATVKGSKQGKVAREILAESVKEFGRKAVDDALAAGPLTEEKMDGQAALASAQTLHGGQQSVAARISVRARFYQLKYESNAQRAIFEFFCPQCHQKFEVRTDSPAGHCRCDGVNWRMNLTILTQDFAPHSWHPETIRTAVLNELYSRFYSPFGSHLPYCKDSAKLWDEIEKEFDRAAAHAALSEV